MSRFASNLVRGLPIDVHVRDLFFSCQAVSNSRKSAVVLYFYIAVIIQLLLHVCTCLRYLDMHAYTTHLVVSLTYVSTDMSTCIPDICPEFSMSDICLTVCRHICLTVCLTYVQSFLCLTYVRHKAKLDFVPTNKWIYKYLGRRRRKFFTETVLLHKK